MRKAVGVVLGALVIVLLASMGVAQAGAQTGLAPSASVDAQAAPAATIVLLHGLPGVIADVTVGGQIVIPNFQPGQIQDLSAFAGQTLRDVAVRSAGSTNVLIGPIASLTVPGSGNVTIVAHLLADGTPTLTTFDNDTTPIPAGQGRLTIRHVAGAPAASLMVGPTMPFVDITNGSQVSALLPAGPVTQVSLLPAGSSTPVPLPDLTLRAGEHLIVYATGSAAQGTVTAFAQSITGLGAAPTRVNTGDSAVAGRGIAGGAPGVLPALPPLPVTGPVLAGVVLVALAARALLVRFDRG